MQTTLLKLMQVQIHGGALTHSKVAPLLFLNLNLTAHATSVILYYQALEHNNNKPQNWVKLEPPSIKKHFQTNNTNKSAEPTAVNVLPHNMLDMETRH